MCQWIKIYNSLKHSLLHSLPPPSRALNPSIHSQIHSLNSNFSTVSHHRYWAWCAQATATTRMRWTEEGKVWGTRMNIKRLRTMVGDLLLRSESKFLSDKKERLCCCSRFFLFFFLSFLCLPSFYAVELASTATATRLILKQCSLSLFFMWKIQIFFSSSSSSSRCVHVMKGGGET